MEQWPCIPPPSSGKDGHMMVFWTVGYTNLQHDPDILSELKLPNMAVVCCNRVETYRRLGCQGCPSSVPEDRVVFLPSRYLMSASLTRRPSESSCHHQPRWIPTNSSVSVLSYQALLLWCDRYGPWQTPDQPKYTKLKVKPRSQSI